MTGVRLVCPSCGHETAHEKNELDACGTILCSNCGFSELPTGFELAKENEGKGMEILKIVLIILAGIFFVMVGLYLIIMRVWIAPIFFAALIIFKVYKRSRNRVAK